MATSAQVEYEASTKDDIDFAKAVREAMADKSGDDNWRRVPAMSVLGLCPDASYDVEAAADYILDGQGYAPGHFLDD